MKLIIALGNMGKEYEKTRHNFGQIVLDQWLKKTKFAKMKENKKLKALITQGEFEGVKTIAAYPLSFMNVSGEAVVLIKNYFKIEDEDLILVHDDLDIPFGRIKISESAGSAGHKGIQSVIENLHSKEFIRLRLGIGSTKQEKIPTENFVLQKFTEEESKHIPIIAKMAGEALDMAVKDKVEKAMNIYN